MFKSKLISFLSVSKKLLSIVGYKSTGGVNPLGGLKRDMVVFEFWKKDDVEIQPRILQSDPEIEV